MERFIFNRDYFDKDFLPGKSQIEKLSIISIKKGGSVASWNSKLLRPNGSSSQRSIKENDYNDLKELDTKLVLDTEKLIGKLFLRVNLDLSPNSKYILYLMLCLLEEEKSKEKKGVSIDGLRRKAYDGKIKQELTETILRDCKVTIDNKGTKVNLFKAEDEKFSIDLSALILFTDLDEE